MDYYSNPRPELVEFLTRKLSKNIFRGKVLEIGPGNGAFFEHISCEEITESWAIENAVDCSESLSTRFDKVFIGLFSSYSVEIPDNYFDLVVANDVIEHMTDHIGAIAEIKRVLRPGGLLVGSVPNFLFFRNTYHVFGTCAFEYENSGVRDRTHFRFFTFSSLRKIFLDQKFERVVLTGINSPNRTWLRRILAEVLDICSGGRFSRYQQIAFACTKSDLSLEREYSTAIMQRSSK